MMSGEFETTNAELGAALAVTLDPGRVIEQQLASNAVRARLFGESAPVRVGRYRIERHLGAGGMGEVFLAQDDELGRNVALKFLRGRGDQTAQARLVREAQGLARLSHPNVVHIYEVGFYEQRPFLAMEYVDGWTLRRWAEQQPRSRAQQLAVLVEAARGLAAAHAKGLVHRDFKPDNVMIDREGRVRVMDFGLVHLESDPDEFDAMKDGQEPCVAASLTMTGALMGTPAYMAPEQLAGRSVDARTDQFSFCVVAWELLTGVRPHAGASLTELREAVLAGRLGGADKLPVWLRRALERGLAVEPGERWPSIDALIDALRDDPTYRRRRRAVLLSVLSSCVVVVLGARQWSNSQAQAELERAAAACRSEAAAVTDIWNPRARGRLASRLGTRGPNGADAWSRIETRLDDFSHGWQTTRESVCRATTPDASREPARSCLDARLAQLRAYVDALGETDDVDPNHALESVFMLEPPNGCLDARIGPRMSTATSPDVEAVARIRALLEQANALRELVQFDAAAAVLDELTPEVDRLGWLPLQAELNHATGMLRLAEGDYAAAELALAQGFERALESGHDELALRCATELAWTIGFVRRERDPGLRWLSIAHALLIRLGLEGSPREAALELIAGVIDIHDPGALTRLEHAERLWTQALGAEHPRVAEVLKYQGKVLSQQGRLSESLVLLARVVDMQEQALGPTHPQLARTLNHLANTQRLARQFDAAEQSLDRAAAIQTRVLGPNHPELFETLHSRARVSKDRGTLDDALTQMREVERHTIEQSGAHSLAHAESLHTLGLIHLWRREYDQALSCFEQQESIFADVRDPARAAHSRAWQGRVLLHHGEFEQARARFEQALALGEAARDESTIAAALTGLGLLAVDSDPEQARLLLERALSYPTRPAERANAHFGLARVTADPEQARVLALTAEGELSIGGVDPDLEEQLDAFLASEGSGDR